MSYGFQTPCYQCLLKNKCDDGINIQKGINEAHQSGDKHKGGGMVVVMCSNMVSSYRIRDIDFINPNFDIKLDVKLHEPVQNPIPMSVKELPVQSVTDEQNEALNKLDEAAEVLSNSDNPEIKEVGEALSAAVVDIKDQHNDSCQEAADEAREQHI